MTYNDIMSQLATAKKVNTNGDGGWEYVRTTRATEQTLQRLGPASQDGGACQKEKGKTQEGSGP